MSIRGGEQAPLALRDTIILKDSEAAIKEAKLAGRS
jgi:hypothetical protein